jgi:4-hydroxy-tetrahydrodipicolinate reductase
MSQVIQVALLGVTGRLGRAIGKAVLQAPDFALTGAVVRAGSPSEGEDIGDWLIGQPCGCRAVVALDEAVAGADIVIDASLPRMTVATAEHLAGRGGPPLVSGVTGFDREQEERLAAAARTLPLLSTGNFSLGIALAQALIAQAAGRLRARDWDIEVEETHHRMKPDAPSGTALMLGRAAADARGEDLDRIATPARHGTTGPRQPGSIGFAVTRGGTIVGEHAVRFLGDMEEIAISHRAFDRSIFANGALEAARWMAHDGKGRPPGLYSMQDVVLDEAGS